MLIFFGNELHNPFFKKSGTKNFEPGTNRPQKISFYISQNTEKSV